MKTFYVYIITNRYNQVLYTGITNNIYRRTCEHKNQKNSNSFSAKYNVDKLVYVETFENPNVAIAREKQIKAGSRANKINLIEKINPHWKDLFFDLLPS